MRRAHVVYCFGAFDLDPATRQVTSGAGSVYLTDPQWALLLLLVTSAPDVVDKDALAKAGWGGAAISPNSIERVPTDAAAHAALGMACALIYEASRVEPTRDLESLSRAMHYARLATTIDPALGDGWSTLGFAAYLDGDTEAPAIGRKAVVLEPDVWRHWLRLSYVSWGDKGIESANRALGLHPDLALAYWLKSAVLIARGAVHLRRGEHDAADASFRQSPEAFGSGLQSSPASHAGWILPVEPILNVSARPDLWSAALTLVQQRAS